MGRINNKSRRAVWIFYQQVKKRWERGDNIKISLLMRIKAQELGISPSSAWNIIKMEKQ